MYDAVASSRSAVRVEQLSITAEPSRPALRTEEAAEWRAPPVSSRASSSFLSADRPNSSIDSLASLPSSAAVSVTVLKVVTMFLQSLGWLACVYSNRQVRARLFPLGSRGRTRCGPPGDDLLRQRKLHYRKQYLHLAVCAFSRRVFSGRNPALAKRVLGACPGVHADEEDNRAIGSNLPGRFCAE